MATVQTFRNHNQKQFRLAFSEFGGAKKGVNALSRRETRNHSFFVFNNIMHMCTKQMPGAFIVLVSSGSIPANAPSPNAVQSPDTEVRSLRFNISEDYEGEM